MKNISTAIEYNQAYSDTTPVTKELIEKVDDDNEFSCSNNKCDFRTTDDSFKFCPKCGSKIEQPDEESLYKILRSHSIDNLKLSSKIINRIKIKFSNIGDLYDAELEDIRMKYIQDVRIINVKNSVIEYMAG